MPSLIHIPQHQVLGPLTPAGRRPGADSGDPQLRTYSAGSGTPVDVGVWECRPGGWPVVDRPTVETCYIISGRATLTDQGTGTAVEVSAGDFVVLPRGWTGRWDVTETLRKAYSVS